MPARTLTSDARGRSSVDAKRRAEVGTVPRGKADEATAQARELFYQLVDDLKRGQGRAGKIVQSAALLAKRFSSVTGVRAWHDRALATVEHWRGDSPLAIQRMRSAAKRFERSRAWLEAGETWRALVDLYARRSLETHSRKAAASARRCFSAGKVAAGKPIADLEMNLGNLDHQFDRLDSALSHYKAAERIYRRLGDDDRTAFSVYNQSNLLVSQGAFEEGREKLNEAQRLFKSLGLESLRLHVEFALAALNVLEGQVDDGASTFQSLSVRWAELGDRRWAAHATLERAEAVLRLNRPEAARQEAESARDFFQKAKLDVDLARTHGTLGSASLQLGDSRQAIREFRAGKKIYDRSGNGVGSAYLSLGIARAELLSGRASDAARTAVPAARRLERAGFPSRAAWGLTIVAAAAERSGRLKTQANAASRALRLAQRAGDLRVQMAAHLALAKSAMALENRAAAFKQLRAAERLVERLRLGITTEESRLSFAADKFEVYEQLVMNRLAGRTKRSVAEALRYVERGKARLFAEQLAGSASRRRLTQRGPYKQLMARFDKLDRAVSAAESHSSERGSQGLRGGNAGLRRAYAGRARAMHEICKRLPFEALALGAGPLNPETAQRALSKNELVLEYFVAGDEVHLFAVERDEIRAHRAIARLESVRCAAEQLQFLLGKGVLGDLHHDTHRVFIQRACAHRLRDLESLLLAPERDRLTGRQLLIVPHGALHGIPFHALQHGDNALIDRASVSYLPSLATLGLLRSRPQSRGTGRPMVVGVGDDGAPAIVHEARMVSRILQPADLLSGADATRSALTLDGASSPVLHVACHGFYSAEGGGQAGLRLGDAWMDLSEVYDLTATSDLVVLSGCETGRGTVHAGDEWIGLAAGFLQAGARTVVAASWELHDQSIVSLVGDFYEAMRAGMNVSEAMAQAQRRARRTFGSPLRWAPFFVLGDPLLRLPARMVA